jgi:hypothetical protein
MFRLNSSFFKEKNQSLLKSREIKRKIILFLEESERQEHVKLHIFILRSCDRASRDRFPYNKTTRRSNFSNLFWNETLHFSNSSSVHHQELFTLRSAMVYVVEVCRQFSSSIRMEVQFHPDPAARRLSTNL